MPDTIFPESQGMDNNNLDINQGLQNNQDNITGSSFNTNFNIPRTSPNLIGPSTLETPNLEPKQSSFVDDLQQSFSKGDVDINNQDNAHLFGSQLPQEAFSGRFPTYLNGLNNEDLAAKKQSTIGRIANGVAKTIGTAGITFAQGIVAPIYGAYEGIRQGSFSAIYDNDAMKALDEANKKMENYFPNYVSDKEKNTPWWIPTSNGLFSANFLFDHALKMAGFMAGMAGSAYVLGGIGSVIGDAMPAFGKAAASGQLVETLADAEQIVNQVQPATRFATWAQKLKQADVANFNIFNKGQRLVANTFASAGISASMSLETMNSIRENLKQDFIRKNGQEPGEADLQRINDLASSAGNSMFGLSSLISAYSFHGALGKIMGGFEKNEIKNIADQVVLKQGDKELSSGLQSAGKQGVEETMYGIKSETPSWYDQSAFGKSTVGRVTKRVGSVWSPKAAFGMAEFNTLTPGVNSYYNKKFNGQDTDIFDDFIVPGVKDIFTEEGLKSAFLGGLVGGVFEMSGKKTEKANKAIEQAHLAGIVKGLNDSYAESFLKSQVDHYKRASAIAEQQAGLSPDDVLNRRDASFDYLHNYITERVKHGLTNMIKSDLDQYREIASTPEGLQQLKDDGIIHKDIKAEVFNAHLDNIQKIADRTAAKYEQLNATYGTMNDRTGKRVYPAEVLEKMLYSNEKINNYTDRINKLVKKNLDNKVPVNQFVTHLETGDNSKARLEANRINDFIEKQFITDEQKANLKRDTGDLARLYNRKRAFIKEYNDIKDKPFDYKEDIIQNIVSPSNIGGNTSNPAIKLTHANSKTDADGNIIPSDVEMNTEYFAGGIESPGKYENKITPVREFAKFKITGEGYKNHDGSITPAPALDVNGNPLKSSKRVIKVSYDDGRKETWKDADVFKNLKLSKVSDVENNTKAKFYIDHANDVFTFKFSRDGEEKKGTINYNKDNDALMFKYRGNDGKVYTREVDLEDFTTPRNGEGEPRLRFLDSKIKISPEEYQRLKDYQDPNRQAKAQRQLEIVDKVLKGRKEELDTLKEKVKEHEDFLEQVKDDLAKLQNKIEKDGIAEKSLSKYSKELSDMQDFHDSLQDELGTLLERKEELQSYVDSIEDSMSNLMAVPDGTELIDFLKKGAQALQDQIKNNDTIVTQLKGLISKARNFIDRLSKSLLSKIEKFEKQYVNAPEDVMVSPIMQSILEANANPHFGANPLEGITYGEPNLGVPGEPSWESGLRSFTSFPAIPDRGTKDYTLSKGSNKFTGLSDKLRDLLAWTKENPEYLSDKSNVKEGIQTVEIKESEIESHLKAIKELQEDSVNLQKKLDTQNSIINAFEEEYRRWRNEELLTRAYDNSKAVKTVLKFVQGEMNNQSGTIEPISPDEPDVIEKLKTTDFTAKKSVAERGLASSIIVDDTNKSTPFYNQHNKWPERERAFTNIFSKNSFNPTPGDTSLKGQKLSADNVKVIAIHKGNQDGYGFGGFIGDTYKNFKGEEIQNGGAKRDNAKAAIALVYVYDHEGTMYTMDKDGKLLNEVSKNTQQSPNEFVFTYLDNSTLKRTGAYEPDTDKFFDTSLFTKEELNEIEQKYTKERGDILDSTTIYPEKFQLSSGKFNVTRDLKTNKIQIRNNSVIDTGIITLQDVNNTDTVSVATLESSDRKGYANIGGKFIPLGLTYVNTKTGPVIVNTRRLNETDANNIYNILKKVTKSLFETYSNTSNINPEEGAKARVMLDANKKTQSELKKYLRNVLFFRTPLEGRALGRNQIYFNEFGELVIGKKPIKLNVQNIEDPNVKQDIITLLSGQGAERPGLFHNVNNWTLKNEPGVFTELKVDNDGNIQRIHWKNYQSYLLSSKYDLDENSYENKEDFNILNGKNRNSGVDNFIPLTVNAIKPVNEGEYATVNRYITVNSIGERITPKPKVETPTPVETSATPSIEKTKEPVKSTTPEYRIKFPFTKSEQPIVFDGELHEIKIGPAEQPFQIAASEKDGAVSVRFSDSVENTLSTYKDAEDIKEGLTTNDPTTLALVNSYKQLEQLRDSFKKVAEDKLSSEKTKVVETTTSEVTSSEKGSVKTKEDLRKEIENGKMFTEMTIAEQKILDEPEPQENKGLTKKEADNGLKSLLERRGGEKKGRPNFRIIQEEEEGVLSPKDHADFMAFMKKNLPGADVKVLDDIIRLTNNKKAWGKAEGNLISIFKDAPTVAKYHEAFHYVFDTLLTPKEKTALYTEFKKREGGYKDLASGEIKSFNQASNYEIEDRLAEEFGHYKTGKKLADQANNKMNFFQRLWNAIKALFKGPNKAKEVFKKINEGGFSNIARVNFDNEGPKYSIDRGIRDRFTPEVINNNVKGIAYLILKDARIEEGGISRIVQGKKTFNDLINPVKEYYTQYFTGKSLDVNNTEPVDYTVADNSEYSDDKVAELYNNWNDVLSNWTDYAQEVKNYLKSKKIVFETPKIKDLTPDDTIHPELSSDEVEHVTEQGSNYNNRDYGVDITKLDAKDNSPIEIKILFDSIPAAKFDGNTKEGKKLNSYNPGLAEPPTTLSSNGMPTLIGDNSMFYKVMGALNGAIGLDQMEARFKKLAQKTPELVRPYKALFETPTKYRTSEQNRMAMLFEKTFMKQKPDYILQRIDEDGNVYTFNANQETDAKAITQDFFNSAISKFGKSDLISLDDFGNYSFNSNYSYKNDPIKAPVEFLKEIGYNFPQEVFDKLTSAEQKQLGQESERLKSQLKNIRTKSGVLVSESSVDTDAIQKIAELYVSGDGVFKSSQHLSIGGEPLQNYILPNNFSVRLSRITQLANFSRLKEIFPEYNDVFSRNSLLLRAKGTKDKALLFDEEGNVAYKIVPTITEGLRTTDSTTATPDMNLGVRFMQGFNMNVGQRGEGNFYNLIPADSKSEWGAQIKHYVPISDYSSSRYNNVVRDIFRGYLADEIDLIKDFNKDPNRSKYEQLAKEVGDDTGLKIGQRLRFFKDILDKDLVKEIHDYASGDDTISTNDYIKTIEKKFNSALKNFFDKQIKETQDFLEDNRILDISENGYLWRGLSTSFINEMSSHNEGFDRVDYASRPNFSETEVKEMIGFRNINLIIHNIELHKIWAGDPAMYKDETKRIKLFLSGKEFTHIDGENQQGMNYSLNRDTNKVGDVTLSPGQLGYHSNADTFDIVTYDHNDQPSTSYVSPNVNQYIEILGQDRGDKYTEINGIDAQSHMGLPWYREHKLKTGLWSDAQEAQYQYDMALMRKEITERFNAGETKFSKFAYKEGNSEDEALRKASDIILSKGNPEVISAFYIDKPLGSGIYANSDTLTPFALKTSTFALSWEAVRGRHMEDLYLNMLENNIGYSGPKSQHKVGTLADTPVLYDKATGRIGLTGDQMNASKQTISWQDFGKIVETNSSHDKVTLGSQLTKQDTLGLFDTGLPKDFFDSNEASRNKEYMGQKISEWNSLTHEQKIEKSDYYKWFDIKNKCLEAFGNTGKDNLFETLGIGLQDGNPVLHDVEKLIGFLNNEVTRRDLPENLKEALDFEYNATTKRMELKNPLEALSNFNQLRSIINSTIDKNISKPKVSGAQMILVSSTGFDSQDTPLKKMVKGKEGWSEISNDAYAKLSDKDKKGVRLMSENLKAYTKISENGKERVTRMQVYVPNIFIEKMKNSRTKLTDEQLFDYLNMEEGKKLLYGVGFRIPTQGQNSIDSFEIVPFDIKNKRFFMPSSYGHAIVVPAELATKVGSDFDVDKLNCYFKNHYIDNKGYPRLVEFIEDTTNRDNLLKLYTREYGKRLKNLNRFNTLEVDTLSEKLVKEIFGEEAEGIIPTFDEFVRDNTGGDAFALNTREAIENKYYDNLHDIICDPKSFEQLIAPNDASELKNYEGYINNIKQRDLSPEQRQALETSKAAENDINYSNLTNSVSLNQERQNFMDAKDQVGVAASNNSNHAITMTSFTRLYKSIELSEADATLIGNNDLTIKLPHNQVEMKVNDKWDKVSVLSGGKVDGKYIADKLSQVIDGTVDAAKDPWLMRLFPSKEALSTALFLTRMGTPMNNIVLFLHQPSVLRYIKEQNGNRTVKSLDTFAISSKKRDIIEQVKQRFPSVAYAPREVGRLFTVQELSDLVAKANSGKTLTAQENATQKQILDEYVKYTVFAEHLFKKQQGDSWDTLAQPSVSSAYLMEQQLVQSRKNNIIEPTDLSNDFRGNRRKNILETTKAFSTIFKSAGEVFQAHIMPIWDAYTSSSIRTASDTKRQIMDKAQTSFINFLTENFYKVGGNSLSSGIKSLVFGDSFVKKLTMAQEANKEGTPNYNMALDNLRIQYNVYSKDVKNITLADRPKDKYSSDTITESFKALKASQPDLYRNLVILGHLQYGITDSRLSINKFIPVEDYLQAIKAGLGHLNTNSPELMSFLHTNQFYKNNWSNEDICPTLKQRWSEEHQQYYVPGKRWKGAINQNVIELKPDSKNAAYPVVKVKSSVNPETGVDYTPEERNELTRKGFAFKKSVELYRRIEDTEGNPVIVDGKVIYRQINALGDGNNLQEYYTDNRPSVKPLNFKVNEIGDDKILSLYPDDVIVKKDLEKSDNSGNFVKEVKTIYDYSEDPVNGKPVDTYDDMYIIGDRQATLNSISESPFGDYDVWLMDEDGHNENIAGRTRAEVVRKVNEYFDKKYKTKEGIIEDLIKNKEVKTKDC